MFTLSGLQFHPAQSVVSLPEQNKYSLSQTAKSGMAILQNPPIANYAEDFQTRLEVVSRLRVPHTEVQHAYGEFVKKLNEMCYETVAEQLVRSSRPASAAGSVQSQNIRSASKRIVKSDNGSNSTIQRLYKAAEGVQKHLSTISESSYGEGLIRPIKEANGRNKSKITVDYEKSLPNMDSTMDHFRSNGALKSQSSKKIVSTKKMKKKIEESSAEVIETEFNITKDSLRSGNIIARGQERRITSVRTNSFKRRQNEDSLSVISKTKNFRKEITQETLHEIRSNHKKTALSPFYQRLHKQRRLSPKTTPLLKF